MDPITQQLLMASGSRSNSAAVIESEVASGNSITFTSTPVASTLILALGVGTTNMGTPSGYTLIAERTGGSPRLNCSYKVAVGSETSVSVPQASVTGYAFITPGAVLDVTGSVVTASNALVQMSSITPAAGALPLFFAGSSNNTTSSIVVVTTGWSEILDSAASLSTTVELSFGRKTALSTGAATGDLQVVFDQANSAGLLFSVKLP